MITKTISTRTVLHEHDRDLTSCSQESAYVSQKKFCWDVYVPVGPVEGGPTRRVVFLNRTRCAAIEVWPLPARR